jgi:hypothetical protein
MTFATSQLSVPQIMDELIRIMGGMLIDRINRGFRKKKNAVFLPIIPSV